VLKLAGYDPAVLKRDLQCQLNVAVDKGKKNSSTALSEKASRLLAFIPWGYPIGNKSLRLRVGFSKDEYWDAREELLTAGLIKIGRGRGGSVARIMSRIRRESGSKKNIELAFTKEGITMKTPIDLPLIGESFHEETIGYDKFPREGINITVTSVSKILDPSGSFLVKLVFSVSDYLIPRAK